MARRLERCKLAFERESRRRRIRIAGLELRYIGTGKSEARDGAIARHPDLDTRTPAGSSAHPVMRIVVPTVASATGASIAPIVPAGSAAAAAGRGCTRWSRRCPWAPFRRASGQPLRIASFCTSNSASVSTPCSLSAPRSLSWRAWRPCSAARAPARRGGVAAAGRPGLLLLLLGPPAGLAAGHAVGHVRWRSRR